MVLTARVRAAAVRRVSAVSRGLTSDPNIYPANVLGSWAGLAGLGWLGWAGLAGLGWLAVAGWEGGESL